MSIDGKAWPMHMEKLYLVFLELVVATLPKGARENIEYHHRKQASARTPGMSWHADIHEIFSLSQIICYF